ncbi:hypothetical protein [Sandarakinorhabdus sp.]|uniref:hypothetical protein n=1 Tax=Sandarakinorhabdus sp. TaxID=1916663 RepID=UPI00286E8AD7|nr:hypothetical protein [Sandarakinorhabdus sp.]
MKSKTLILAGAALLLSPMAMAPMAMAQTAPAVVDPAAEKAAQAAAAAAAKARAKQVSAWKRQYGEGPYPDETDAFLGNKNEALKPYWTALWTGGERNSVLNFQRLGLAAMEVGDWRTAEKSFDAALMRIETVYAKDARASAARSLFAKEANKDFKGEPYERSMAYYYRGLLYLRKGDFGNARASFKGAEFQDTVSEQEEFGSDFAAMNYLIGWSTRCMGDNAGDDFAAAAKAEPTLTEPPRDHNVILIAETGIAPMKVKDGAESEKMVFRAIEGMPETDARFSLAPAGGRAMAVPTLQASSVYYQATTRGGRAMDGILKGKANWKSGTAQVGNLTTQAGLSMMNSGQGGSAGAYVAAAGMLFSMFSSAMKADADVRYWDQLPDGLELATARIKGDFKPSVQFMSPSGPVDLKPAAIMTGGNDVCKVVWTRSRSALTGTDTPGDDIKVRANVARKKDVALKDRAFRNSLADFDQVAS